MRGQGFSAFRHMHGFWWITGNPHLTVWVAVRGAFRRVTEGLPDDSIRDPDPRDFGTLGPGLRLECLARWQNS